jgi:hypothetical protein
MCRVSTTREDPPPAKSILQQFTATGRRFLLENALKDGNPTLYKDLERFSAFLGLERGALRGDGARATLSSVQTRFVLLGKEWVAEPLAYLAG